MKLFIKLLSLILILGLSGPFFLHRPDGRPWLNYRDFLPDLSAMGRKTRNLAKDLKDLGGSDFDQEPSIRTSDKLTAPLPDTHEPNGEGLYRWQDADGRWRFSDHPPATGVTSGNR